MVSTRPGILVGAPRRRCKPQLPVADRLCASKVHTARRALAGREVTGVNNLAGPAPGEGALEKLIDRAERVSKFLKALGHDGRLTILCHLVDGPKSVTELENLLSARQAVVSQQLARLRLEGLVAARRDGNAIYYSIRDARAREAIIFLANLFGKEADI